MGRAKKVESGVTAPKKATIHGGAREGAGRKKARSKLKMITFKLPLQAIKDCARFARARKTSRNHALAIMIDEYATWLSQPERLFTWGGEQILVTPPDSNTK